MIVAYPLFQNIFAHMITNHFTECKIIPAQPQFTYIQQTSTLDPIWTHQYAHQGARNVSSSENFTCILNELSLREYAT